MPVYTNASVLDIQQLLDLFPVAELRSRWPDMIGSKGEICRVVAQSKSREDIADFIQATFSCCKQHVWVCHLYADAPASLPEELLGGERIRYVDHAFGLYILSVSHSTVLYDPLEYADTHFLWPVLVEYFGDYLLIRLATLERSLEAYFGRKCSIRTRGAEDADVVNALNAYHNSALDLHQGIKALWHTWFMDALQVKYRRENSNASDKMDTGKLVRATYPELYEELRTAVLHSTLFIPSKELNLTVRSFTCDPSKGFISFSAYSERQNGTDHVVARIIEECSIPLEATAN